MSSGFGWTDIEEIAFGLYEQYPAVDPMTVRFTELRHMIEQLDDFMPVDDRHPNEQILEAIQAAWCEAFSGPDKKDASGSGEGDAKRQYKPNEPFR